MHIFAINGRAFTVGRTILARGTLDHGIFFDEWLHVEILGEKVKEPTAHPSRHRLRETIPEKSLQSL